MNDDTTNINNQQHDDGGVPASPTPAEILRGCADGEDWAERILDESPGALGAFASDADGRIAFERELRTAVGRCCENESITTPADLRACVENMLRGEADHDDHQDAVAGRIGSVAESKQPAPGVFAKFGPLLAMAAVMVLGATLVINALNTTAPGNGLGWDETRVQNVAGFISRQHDDCSAFGAGYERKFQVPESVEAGEAVAREKLGESPAWFGDAVRAMVNDGGYSFAGIAGCGVPGAGASVHMIFRPATDSSGAPVSIFIQKATPGDVREGVCYSCAAAEQKGRPVNFWVYEGYLIYAHAASVEAIQTAREAFDAPGKLSSI